MVKKKNPVKIISITLSVLVIVGVIVFAVGKSFAFFNYKKAGEVVNVVTFNGLSATINNSSSDAFNLTGAYPVYDFQGMENQPLEFTITSHSSKIIDYTVKVENDLDKQNNCIVNGSVCPQLSTNYIRYSYQVNNGSWSEPENLGENGNIVLTSTILSKESDDIKIKIWIASEAPNSIQGTYFYGKVVLEATKSELDKVLVYDFYYTGGEQTFTPKYNGRYKLEVWGAQGGNYYSENGNYGGYSTGVVNLTSSTKLYINVGGQGSYVLGDRVDDPWGATNSNIEYASGGYNGGGDGSINSNDQFANSGGGASHIALVSGELKNLSSYKDTAGTNISNEIIIVAGGGGACHGWTSGAQWFGTLSGGGFKTNQGNAGNIGISEGRSAQGATQTTGYAFGQGQSGRAGAGGGWYGGYSSTEQIATGGTGYIANPNLTDKAMYCIGCEESSDPSTLTITTEGSNQNLDKINCPDGYKETPTSKCAKLGNGHVRITYLEKTESFKDMILSDNTVVTSSPTLTTTSEAANENGLYKMSVTNGFGGTDGDTYYFRGDVTNNIVEFAGKTWRIVRINEDGTIRLILDTSIDTTDYVFANGYNGYTYMYYSNDSNAKSKLESWYSSNITGDNAAKVTSGNYFCETAKVTSIGGFKTATGTTFLELKADYTPDLKCESDANGKDYVNGSIGLITYDEIVLAGGGNTNKAYYLYKGIAGDNNYTWWTMSPGGVNSGYMNAALEWIHHADGYAMADYVGYVSSDANMRYRFRPVINLKADVTVTKDTTTGHYIVQ